MDSDLKAVEDAEVRLESRSRARREQLEQRDRRRRWPPGSICLVPLPALGAGALLAVIDASGGDLRDLAAAAAGVARGGCLLVPALLVGLGRAPPRHGSTPCCGRS